MPATAGTRHTYAALRAGVLAGAWSVGGSFARGLIPRSTTDQALATGAIAAFHLGAGTVAHQAGENVADDLVEWVGRGSPEAAVLAATGIVGGASMIITRVLPATHEGPLAMHIARSAAQKLAQGSAASATVLGYDIATRRLGVRTNPALNLAAAAAIGSAVAAFTVYLRDRRADALGLQDDERLTVVAAGGAAGVAKAAGMGLAAGAGLLGIAVGELLVAEGATRGVSWVLGRNDNPVTPLVGHAIALGGLTVAGGYALDQVRRRVQHQDDVVEPAYPHAPVSDHVTAGPRSEVPFDTIGKEGRRFVTMVTTPEAITDVMGEPSVHPVRVVAGYETTKDVTARARIAVDELGRLGGFDRSAILVAAPTGVGYVNYVVIEALEYLTRGDVATVVPQYALVPSALALDTTPDAVILQTLVLEGIRDRIATIPEASRPQLWQFGESLGAQVALDVIGDGTTVALERLGVDSGLYLGVPFRTRAWARWFDEPTAVDPRGLLTLVSQPDEARQLTDPVRHLMVVHHDDPVNKFAYDAAVRPPWWLGPPETRPPGVPRETKYRPFSTFVLMLVDLKNGMNSKPGTFVRQGHDYRIDAREALQVAFGLDCTAEQADRIEDAIRRSEQEWAARRMVARKFERARSSVVAQLKQWGVNPADLDLDEASAGELATGNLSTLNRILGSSGTS